tara:strand:- start:966 stop:1373 length:408 start_codon:yes stop_codon:yes gene_type:complete
MGNNQSNNINYEDIQNAITNNYIIINTLENNNQDCLIKNTLNINEEIVFFNNKSIDKNSRIYIYGMNSIDDTVFKKYKQLTQLGYNNIYIYIGGLFEWLLLQDIYGFELFSTTKVERDILKYKGKSKTNNLMIKN